uniref:Mucin 5AC, oligomeric mucus/gel-forming n=1 Tax=Balaenoptera musculus TaxID=9771 RepID=A0A8C0CX77_BALMU
VTIHPPLRSSPLVRALNAAHGGRVCSTWGDFHYKTFDGDVFRFPGLCNYVFSAHCGAAYEDFNLQLRRGPGPNATAPSRVTMKLDGMVVELTKGSVLVNGRPAQLPFSHSGVFIEQSSSYVKVAAKLGLVFMWNQDDSLLLELDAKYANQTCGLCGDFNGVPIFNEFFSHNIKLTPTEFGNLQKMDGPTERCQDPAPEPPTNCLTGFGICEEVLSSELFSDCAALVDTSSYLEACRQDLCRCDQANPSSCLCHTLAEYSRQCSHAGGLPLDWRRPQLCPQTCPLNMQYHECGSPCADTCSNPERSPLCEDHCVAGCFCPEGTVLDDIGHAGCIPVPQCSCVYNGATYTPGTGYSTDCTNCTCSGGRWRCQEVQCPGTCSVLGGAHFSTFDERQYTVHGDCSYVLAKPCDSSAFTVLAELRRCGLTDSETCLKSLTLILGGGHMVSASGEVFVNQIYTQLPLSAANITLFRPSTFFIIAQTQLGLQLDVQLVPVMQVFVRLAPQLRGQTCGLCGNFNRNQADDFRTVSGVVEGTAAAFANTWKTQAACPNVKNGFEDPCSFSVENEKYAQRWCSRLTDPHGPFARCHAAVNPSAYYSNCMFDTCSCEKSEDCMCAALSSYVRACAARGVLLGGWRDGVCTKPMTTCPKSLTYLYNISTCQPTCRARSDADATCSVSFVPVDGCTCPDGTFLDDMGKCVPATSCPCYRGGSVVPDGESTHEQGVICTCTQGTLTCIGGHAPAPVCTPPMVYFDCRNTTPGAAGAGCQKSCHTLDMDCYSSQCVPGCVCPHGLVANGDGGCIPVSDCPCVHNEASYQPGQIIRVGCNTCTCKSRMWQCTDQPCPATCAVYGDGHYLTFDGQRYSFSGDCEYTLLQDHCGGNGSAQDGFRVITENVPCGTTGTTCSKAIKIFLGSYELKLSDGNVEVIEKERGQLPPFSIRQMGIYLVVDTDVSLVLLWDKGTSIFLRLSPEFKGRVCGLCGNFDDNALNDFTTRSQSVVGDALEFGNSWKFSPSCPDAQAPKDPCAANPYRKPWAQKQCSVVNSATFSACHAHVESARYYEACVSDACACDSGGDCECFCTAVAAYAQACHEAGVCVSWRTPDVCPLFCDYYNPQGQCEWHYQPCGAPFLRTCRNPRGQYLHDVRGLEGCYPKCPSEAPIFDEDQMRCVASCPTPTPPTPCRVQGKSYRPGSTVPLEKNCHYCVCTESGVHCTYDSEACVCTYDGKRFRPGEVIYHTTDGTGGCISAHCGANGTIERRVEACSPTPRTPQTTFIFSTTPFGKADTRGADRVGPSPHPWPQEAGRSQDGTEVSTTVTTTTSVSTTTPGPSKGTSSEPTQVTCLQESCTWTKWIDGSYPGAGRNSGDFDSFQNLRSKGYKFCAKPKNVECRAEVFPNTPLQALGQNLICDKNVGLICWNKDQLPPICYNYQIRILCCEVVDVSPTGSTTIVEITSPATAPRTSTTTVETTSTTPVPTIITTTVETTSPTTAPRTSTTTVETAISTTTAPTTSTTTVETTGPTSAPTTSTTFVPIPETTPSQPGTTSCQPQCTWTKWFDVDFPSPGPHGGDFETYSNIVRRGEKICHRPEYISALECRAENHPDVSIHTLGQVVQCSPEVGLVCRNQDQKGKIRMCLNYEVRVLCCDTTTVETASTTSAPTTSTTTVETTSPTSAPSSSTTFVPIPETTPSQPGTTSCQPQCTWTKWFDVDFPSPGPHGGDFETYSNIVRRGEKICHRPEYISALECRAENHPDVSIQTLGQVVQCSPEVGLVCRNQDQKGKFRMCFNYEVRVLCCEPQEGCPVTHVTVPSTSSVSVTSHTRTTSHEATSSATTVQTTSPTAVPITSTTTVETTSTTSALTTSTTTVETASTTPVPTIITTTVETTSPTTAPRTSTTTVETASKTSAPRTSTTTVETTGPTTALRTSTTTVETTSPTTAPTTSTTTVETTSPTTAPTTSTTSVETTSTNSVEKTSTTSAPTTSTTTVETTGPTTAPPTSTTTVETASTTLAPTTSTTTVETASTTLAPTTSTTTVETTSPTPVPTIITTTVETTSTTSAPTTSTTFVPIPETTPSQPGTTSCQPQCTWTKWFDVDFPSPGPHGGDFETYSNIVRRGEKICHRPEHISALECRAENHPDVSIHTLGQVVQCSPEVGLVCRNQDQKGKIRMCLNYEVRVLCCEPQKGCPVTQVTVPSTSGVSVTSHTRTTSHEATSSPTTTPSSSTTFVPIPETTPSQPGTTSCQPQCTWTKWFDVDFPSPGPHGGDFETYNNIVRRGEKICHRPEHISALECRAENHPDVSIQTLGQVVQCSPEVGLVCRNQDQKGKFRMCLNYEVRVLCCEPQKGCLVNSVTPFVTSSPQSSLSPESTTFTVSLVTSHSSAAPSTSTCYCSVAHGFYSAGSIIYQQTDLSGHCYYAVCSLDCHVVRRTDHTCPTSTPPPAPATSTPASSPSASVPAPQRGCPNAVPPRMKGETWAMPNCSEATCEGNGAITVRSRQCPKVQELTCANGYPAVTVANQEDCCPHYMCQCVCSGWGDPHYLTFDGTYYTLLDNCTYVLVQQIVPVFGHFRVLIDNYFCDAEDRLSCPQSIIVEYQQDRVVLTRKPVRGVMTNEIIFNGEVVRPGFQKDGIIVSQIGIKMYVAIPALGVQVMFSGLIFSVEVPFSKFSNNTEGQCGTCTNDQKDECRLPGGAVVSSCSDMSGHWNVTYPGQPSCHRPPLTPTTVEPKKSPTSCPPSPICLLILSEVFKPCHSVIPPWPYYQGCTFDQCHMPRGDVVCSSLELYATLCASLSVCIDWRGLTNHTCSFTCPADKVYRPCGPSNPSYSPALSLWDTPTPPRVPRPPLPTLEVTAGDQWPGGPMSSPCQPGHTVSVGCQECTCKGSTRTLSCQTRPCPLPPTCPEPGFVPAPAALQTGQCCPQYTCVCNATHCPAPVDCPEGSHSILTYKEGACCPTRNCSWTVCSINGTLYQPGAIVSSNLCEKCWCELAGGPQSDTFVISCETQICSTRCPVGFEYQTRSGQCCGECVQVACVMNTSSSSAHLFYPGEPWSDPRSRCVTHECEKHQDGLVVVTTKKACPPLSCPADKARLSEDGCCLACPQNRSTCTVYHKLQVLRQPGCSSVEPVRLTYCQGNCGDTGSVYSLEAHTVEHRCRCCRELRASLRNVTLRCEDGSSRAFSYTEVEECGCVGLQCDSHGGLSRSGEVQLEQGAERSQETGLRHWRRGAPGPRPSQ